MVVNDSRGGGFCSGVVGGRELYQVLDAAQIAAASAGRGHAGNERRFAVGSGRHLLPMTAAEQVAVLVHGPSVSLLLSHNERVLIGPAKSPQASRLGCDDRTRKPSQIKALAAW